MFYKVDQTIVEKYNKTLPFTEPLRLFFKKERGYWKLSGLAFQYLLKMKMSSFLGSSVALKWISSLLLNKTSSLILLSMARWVVLGLPFSIFWFVKSSEHNTSQPLLFTLIQQVLLRGTVGTNQRVGIILTPY